MNIVYAVKIFATFMVVALVMRIVVGRGLRLVMQPKDFQTGWWGIAGTLFVGVFSITPSLYFVFLPIWALVLSKLFGKDGSGRLPAYVLLACISPQMSVELENIGPLKDILYLTPARVCAVFLLAPEALRQFNTRREYRKPGWLTASDVATFGYFAYWLLNLYGGAAASVIVREGMGLALDTVLPYYVITRACVSGDVRRRVLSVILFGAAYESFVGMAESASGKYLYSQLQFLYDVRWAQSTGLMRGAWLRAEAAFSGPLLLAVLLMFAGGVWFALKPEAGKKPYLILGLSIAGGLLATYGRGPLLAAGLMLLGVMLLRHMSRKTYLIVTVVGLTILAAAWSAGVGDMVVGLVSKATGADETADFNVLYRQQLLSTSLALLKQSPWFGVPNYLQSMESLRQGEGIIDLVNTYLVVSLNVGSFGLLLYLIPFGISLWKEAVLTASISAAALREGAMWLPLTVAVMAAVFTVSPIAIVQQVLGWSVAFALARLQETSRQATDRRQPIAGLASPT